MGSIFEVLRNVCHSSLYYCPLSILLMISHSPLSIIVHSLSSPLSAIIHYLSFSCKVPIVNHSPLSVIYQCLLLSIILYLPLSFDHSPFICHLLFVHHYLSLSIVHHFQLYVIVLCQSITIVCYLSLYVILDCQSFPIVCHFPLSNIPIVCH